MKILLGEGRIRARNSRADKSLLLPEQRLCCLRWDFLFKASKRCKTLDGRRRCRMLIGNAPASSCAGEQGEIQYREGFQRYTSERSYRKASGVCSRRVSVHTLSYEEKGMKGIICQLIQPVQQFVRRIKEVIYNPGES